MSLNFIMIATDPGVAAHAVAKGVDLIMVDLEVMGKAARQGHYDSWKSGSAAHDIDAIRAAVPHARILVRLNPWHDGTAAEVDDVLARGADALMLPMFRDAETVARFRDLIAGRATCLPLVETAAALKVLPQVAAHADQVHIGLNDLSLDLGLPFMFQPMESGLLDDGCAVLRAAGIPFGIGGIARAGGGAVPPETVLGEHVRLGSSWVILSRSFHNRAETLADLRDGMDFAGEVQKLRRIYDRFRVSSPTTLAENQTLFRSQVAAVVAARS